MTSSNNHFLIFPLSKYMVGKILSNSGFVSSSTNSSDFGENIQVVIGSQISESIPLFLASDEEVHSKPHPTSTESGTMLRHSLQRI